VRRVHLVRQNVLPGDREVRLRLLVRNVGVLRLGVGTLRRAMSAAHVLQVEAVHSAIGAREAPRAVARLEERGRTVIDIPRRREPDRFEPDLSFRAVVAIGYGLGAWVTVKEVVERAVLLNDDDDVLDLAARGVA